MIRQYEIPCKDVGKNPPVMKEREVTEGSGFTTRGNLPRLSGVSTRSLSETTDERITKFLLPPFTHLRLGYEHNNVANHKVLATLFATSFCPITPREVRSQHPLSPDKE
jgi:hypothetical protein